MASAPTNADYRTRGKQQALMGGRNTNQSDARSQALRSLFFVSRDFKRARYQNWTRNYKIVTNRLAGSNSASWLPQPRDSEVYPIVSSLVGWMTDQDPDIGFIPVADPDSRYYDECLEIASDLDDVFQTTWINEDYEMETKKMLWDGLTYGLGTMKTFWDNAADGGAGNAVWKRIDPWMMYHDPYATSYKDCEFFIEARRVSYDELERMFPDTYNLIKYSSSSSDGIDERPSFNDDGTAPKAPFLGNALAGSASWATGAGGNTLWNNKNTRNKTYEPLPGYVLYEYWIRENTVPDDYGFIGPDSNAYRQPKWRCISIVDDTILFNEWAEDLWQHGQHPYEDFRFDDIGEMYGISLVDHLAFPQIYINRLLTALQQNAELVGNPIFLEPTNSGLSRIGIINRPGQRLPVNSAQSAGSNLPRWLEPPSMPSQVQDLVQFWIARIENTAGMTGLQKGQAPNQRNAEGTISGVQDAAFVRVRSALSNLQTMYRRLAVKSSDLIAQNYTEPRTMALLGKDGTSLSMSLKGRHFYSPGDNDEIPMKFVVPVEAGANQATSRQARMANAEKMFALGIVDDSYVLKVHGVKDADKILARLYAKRQAGVLSSPGARQRAGRQS